MLILGTVCSRDCRFCAVASGVPDRPDPREPKRVALAVKSAGLRYAVITSVTRDDLPDGGAAHFSETMREIRRVNPATRIEVLVPDFAGKVESLHRVLAARPEVLNHNLETVERLSSVVRPQAGYARSLELLTNSSLWSRKHRSATAIKSGLILGLGETSEEIQQALEDLHSAGVRLLTLGQYLSPTPSHYPVHRYLLPWEFDAWNARALSMGFAEVAAGPLVRSSYQSDELYRKFREAMNE
jgi:lipoic acid synthetase